MNCRDGCWASVSASSSAPSSAALGRGGPVRCRSDAGRPNLGGDGRGAASRRRQPPAERVLLAVRGGRRGYLERSPPRPQGWTLIPGSMASRDLHGPQRPPRPRFRLVTAWPPRWSWDLPRLVWYHPSPSALAYSGLGAALGAGGGVQGTRVTGRPARYPAPGFSAHRWCRRRTAG